MQKLFMFVVCIGLLFMPSTIVNSEQPSESEKTVPVCHDGETLLIPESELQEHLEHGDTEGACPAVSAKPSEGKKEDEAGEEEGKEEGDPQEKVIICHKGWLTLSVAEAAIPAHLKHGDTLGACPDSSRKKGDLKKTEEKKTDDKDSEEKKPEQKQSSAKKGNQGKGKGKGKSK